MNNKRLTFLKDLGFSEIEAEVYLYLIKQPGITGYKIAKKLNKRPPNIYKILDNLQLAGAVLAEEEQSKKKYSALPIKDIIKQRELTLRKKSKIADDLFKDVDTPKIETGIYKLKSVEQVLMQCRKSINDAENIIYIDIYPTIIEEFRLDLEEAARRDVKVIVRAYENAELKGCKVKVFGNSEKQLKMWNTGYLFCSVDGKTTLLSCIERDLSEIHYAILSKNPFLSLLFSTALRNQFIVNWIYDLLDEEEENSKIRKYLELFEKSYKDKILDSDISFLKKYLNNYNSY